MHGFWLSISFNHILCIIA